MRRVPSFSDNPNDYIDEQKDLKKHRIWITKFNKVHFIQEPPHGYWSVHLDKGDVKKGLKGMWTTFEDAKAAAKKFYIEPMKEEIREKIY